MTSPFLAFFTTADDFNDRDAFFDGIALESRWLPPALFEIVATSQYREP